MMYTCSACGKEYKYKKAYDAHMATHMGNGEQLVAESLKQVLAALQTMAQRMDAIEEKIEKPPTPDELRIDLEKKRMEKLNSILAGKKAKIVGGLDDDGRPESVVLCGETWTLEVGAENVLPEAVVARVLEQRRLRKERDEQAMFFASRALSPAPRDIDEIRRETAHIRNPQL